MMTTPDLINVGLSEAGNDKLDYLVREQKYFTEKLDGYRFAVSLALAQGVIPPEIAKRTTFLNVGSLDPDQTLRQAVEALMADQLADTTVYRLVERLADWGVNELHAQAQRGDIDFATIFDQLAENAP
jgi:uncharacterized protein YfkK (UPF0435 family)